jgi:hypothetical protein
MKKDSAVEWLHYVSKQRELDKFDWEQAKEMHKQEIINAYWASYKEGQYSGDKTADEYYNETFKSE